MICLSPTLSLHEGGGTILTLHLNNKKRFHVEFKGSDYNIPMTNHPLAGVYAAVVTPLQTDYTPALDDIPSLLHFLAQRGCHGALLLGTTGEGPSFSPMERKAIFKAGMRVRETHPDFRLFAGTGTPSLDETSQLNKIAFNLGFNGVVVLPPYYFRDASEEGLFGWFSQLIRTSVPKDGLLLGYHFPRVSGVPLPLSLLTRLRDSFPDQFAGLKDSSGDLQYALTVVEEFGDRLTLVGNDKLLSPTLAAGASGCITAMANLASLALRRIWERHQRGEDTDGIQVQVTRAREVLENYTPFPASVKGLLSQLHSFPHWPVKPPLVSFSKEVLVKAAEEIKPFLVND
jgi:4-hydroxy-tetrahydrodipicolinate synthase